MVTLLESVLLESDLPIKPRIESSERLHPKLNNTIANPTKAGVVQALVERLCGQVPACFGSISNIRTSLRTNKIGKVWLMV